jgi:TonB family protein
VGQVKSSLYARWQPPSSFTLGGKKLAVVVMIRISRDGGIASIDMKRQSGHRIVDQSVMAALTDRSPLPPFPKDYEEDYLDVEITFRPEDR